MGGPYAKNSSNEARVSISVKRNKNTPKFEGLPYVATIQQTQASDRVILSARARDDDDRVSIIGLIV